MHTFSETGAGVPAFLAKLWRLVEDPETNNLICWSQDGRSFIIQNQAQFARELLPLNYKHNNMASFIRQLNMYGFHKITSIDNGGLKFDKDEMEFTHPCFKRNCPYLLEHIKRKIASTKSIDEKSALKPEAVTKVLQDVKAMRGRQDSLDSRFSVMKQENEALWREIASLRQKHAKQQQIVNKLIQFLITIVQPQRNMTSVKRNMQLMINDIPEKAQKQEDNESETDCGPVIHELGEELLDEAAEVKPQQTVTNSPFISVSTPASTTPFSDQDIPPSPQEVERPHSSVSMMSQNFDFSNQSMDGSGDYLYPEVADNNGLIQAVNNDGSKIFYHITEVPDAQPQEANISPASYNEENVLTTPLVREEMARNQLLKQKTRQKRLKNEKSQKQVNKTANSVKAKMQPLASQQNTSLKNLQQSPQLVQIKSEQDAAVDPMSFLNDYSNNQALTSVPNLLSPTKSEDYHQSNTDSTGNLVMNSPSLAPTSVLKEDNFMAGSSSGLFDPNNFITDDIPADIFEDDSLANNEENDRCVEDQYFSKTQQEPFESSTLNSGKNSTHPTDLASTIVGSEPSTSAAVTGTSSTTEQPPLCSPSILKRENCSNMAVTKYKTNQDLMRDEVSGHLENVQDELEGLKDLLRSDVYSLDQNALLGLFNDSDILASYGIQLTPDAGGSDNKKGSELTAYQPMYDLSDIINDQNDLDADVNVPTTSKSQTLQQKQEPYSSVLNTPYHE